MAASDILTGLLGGIAAGGIKVVDLTETLTPEYPTITLPPEFATRGAYAQSRGVAIRPFAKPAPVRRIGAVWRRSSPRGAALAAVAKIIKEHAA